MSRKLYTASLMPESDSVNVYALNEREARSLCRLSLQNLGYNMYNRLEVYDFRISYLNRIQAHNYQPLSHFS